MLEELVKNENNLKPSEINKTVTRVKAVILNDKNEVLMANQLNAYQFPGGHKEPNETILETLNREIEEETGIKLNLKDIKPFYCLKEYYKDYPEKGTNYESKIYYIKIRTNKLPNLNNTNYTELEKINNFRLEYIPIDKLEEIIKNNIKESDYASIIGNELLIVLNKFYNYLIEED